MIPSQVPRFPTVKSVCRSKAVSDGAVIWRATSSVIARACRFQYGITISVPYDSKNARHDGRPTFKGDDGRVFVGNVWRPIVQRVSLRQVMNDEVYATQ